MIEYSMPVDSIMLVLNDNSKIDLPKQQRVIWLAGITSTITGLHSAYTPHTPKFQDIVLFRAIMTIRPPFST